MNVIRVALSGKMRSGKDMVGQYLVKRHGFTRLAFADKVREIACDLFGIKETDKNRALLQALGYRMCQVDKAVWTKYILVKLPMDRDVVITDMRFPIEYYLLKGLDFCLVRVGIDPEEQWDRIMATEPGTDRGLLDDPSETALDGPWRWDFVLDGGTQVVRLYEHVDEILHLLRARER